MTATLDSLSRPAADPDRDAREIILPDGQTFDLLVRSPTYEQMLADMTNDRRTAWDDRFKAVIYGWRGIRQPNKSGGHDDVGFTWDNFALLCERFPLVFTQAVGYVGAAFDGTIPEGQSKNSNGPSATTSPDGQPQTSETSERSTPTASDVALPPSESP